MKSLSVDLFLVHSISFFSFNPSGTVVAYCTCRDFKIARSLGLELPAVTSVDKEGFITKEFVTLTGINELTVRTEYVVPLSVQPLWPFLTE